MIPATPLGSPAPPRHRVATLGVRDQSLTLVTRVKKVTMPARPFFPFLADGSLAPQAQEPVREIVDLAARKQLGLT